MPTDSRVDHPEATAAVGRDFAPGLGGLGGHSSHSSDGGLAHPVRTGAHEPPCGVRRAVVREPAPSAPVPVWILAGDPITGQGAAAYLKTRREIRILTAERRHEAEVVLILVSWVTEETLTWMQQAADAVVGRDLRFVIVGDGVREHHVLRAISYGLVSVIPRREADFERIVRAVRAVREGQLEMPEVALGWLVNQIRTIQQDVLEPKRLTAAGLEVREVDVLRLLADGLGTPEIAQQLSYSERTVKNIIHGVLTRNRLRNRAHAVAFAVRHGAL
jgi:DNA-binding NarL/FixJ family response regulator